MRPIEFDMSTLSADSLRGLCGWTVQHCSQCPALASWLIDFVGGEALRRTETGDLPEWLVGNAIAEKLHQTRREELSAAQYIYPPFESWTDSDLGRALRGITLLSYADGVEKPAADLIDKLVLHIVVEAEARLCERDMGRSN